MNNTETSLLVVKPDGVEKGLVDLIRDILKGNGLTIKEEVRKILKPGTVESLYWDVSDVRHRDYFSQLVEFMSSAPVHIFVVEGDDAVATVRRIIGKRDPASGVRARWAESIIMNVAHGPHTADRAKREITLLLGDEKMKRVFMIGGMSESGKSTLGRYLDSKGIRRLKIVSFLQRVMEREGAKGDFMKWNTCNIRERPDWSNRMFADEFVQWTDKKGIEFCCLESLYGPDLGVYMRERMGSDRVTVVYVDMDEEVRLRRQMIRQGLDTIEEAKQIMLPRDQIKRDWNVPGIASITDVIIDNSGSLEDLYAKADEMVAKYCPELLMK